MPKVKEEPPYFSIILPTYNRAKFIQNTLESIFNQKFSDFELIIVDDCSTDHTVELLQKYLKDPRIQLIVNPENYERAKSRNIGLKHARGKFATLLDSDDFMYEDNLQDAYDFSRKNPAYHFFRNYFELINQRGKVLGRYYSPPVHKEIPELAKSNFISCIGVFIGREIYKKYFFDENRDILVSEDWEYWLRVRADYKLGTIPKINNGVLHHEGRSMLQFNAEKIIKRKMIIINKTLENAHTRKVYLPYEKEMKAAAFLFVAIQANEVGNSKVALKYLQLTLIKFPIQFLQLRTFIILKNALFNIF